MLGVLGERQSLLFVNNTLLFLPHTADILLLLFCFFPIHLYSSSCIILFNPLSCVQQGLMEYWRWIELFSTVRGLFIPFFCRGFLLSLSLDIEFSCLFLRSETCFHSSSICLFRGRVIRICSLLVEVLFILFSSCVGVPDGLAALNYLDCAIGSLHRRSCFGPYDEFKWNQGESLWLFRQGGGSHG